MHLLLKEVSLREKLVIKYTMAITGWGIFKTSSNKQNMHKIHYNLKHIILESTKDNKIMLSQENKT